MIFNILIIDKLLLIFIFYSYYIILPLFESIIYSILSNKSYNYIVFLSFSSKHGIYLSYNLIRSKTYFNAFVSFGSICHILSKQSIAF